MMDVASVGERLEGLRRAASHTLRAHPRRALLGLLVALPCFRLLYVSVCSLQGPIYGVHEWRQGWTYSVAYAFIHEHASFFFPKHAWRGDNTGIVGMEIPLYPYVMSLVMRALGDGEWIGRCLSFGLFTVALVRQLCHFARTRFELALGYLVMAAFCPAVLCEFRQIQPDPAAVALAMLAALSFHEHGRTGETRPFVVGLTLYTLALCMKTIVIGALPAMASFLLFGERRPSWKGGAARILCFALPLALVAAWDHWAQHLVRTYMQGNLLISIDHDPAAMWINFRNEGLRRFILLGLLENFTSHVVLFPAVLLGVPLAMRRESRSWGLPMLAWFLGTLVLALAFADRYRVNWYYMLLFAPPLTYFGAVGLADVFAVLAGTDRRPAQRACAFGLVLAALLITPQLTELPWHDISYAQHQLAVYVRHGVSGSALYWLAILGAVLAVAAAVNAGLVERVPARLAAVFVAGGAASAMIIPYRDNLQTVRYFTGEVDWVAGHIDAREIRAAVDRFSTERDLFLMDGANPALFARAHRVGFADDAPSLDRHGIAYYHDRGVRFMLHVREARLPQVARQMELLAQGARWTLYCLRKAECPELGAASPPR